MICEWLPDNSFKKYALSSRYPIVGRYDGKVKGLKKKWNCADSSDARERERGVNITPKMFLFI